MRNDHRTLRRGLPLLAVLLIGLAAPFLTAAPDRPTALPGTDTVALQQLSARFAQRDAADREDPLFRDLVSRTSGPQGALNANPDIRLIRIDPHGRPLFYRTTNAVAAQTVSTSPLLPGGGAGFALTGANVQGELAIWDAGAVRTTHQEVNGRVTIGDGTISTHWHSTHAGGTMIASGVQAAARGMSPWANLVSYDWSYDNTEMANAAAGGLLISNHSYGFIAGWYYNYNDENWYWYGDVNVSAVEDVSFGMYMSYTRDWDQIAYDAPYYLIVKAAGNDRGDYPGDGVGHYFWDPTASNWAWSTATRDPDGGSDGFDCITPQGIAKNILTIGAVGDIPGGWTQPSDVVMSSFSGWGPTDDGRIKPDLVANGVGLYSCMDGSDTDYASLSGTSMATPNASGSLNLIAQYYRQTHGGSTARAATLKALAIHTASEAGPAPGPDYMNGWGLLNTLACAQVVRADSASFIRIMEGSLAQGEADTITLYSDGSEPIVATLCWTDPPGDPQPYQLDPPDLVLVNDLDLRVERVSDGQQFLPWVLDPANPAAAATTGDNIRDNVEKVEVASPTSGLYRLIVSHKGTLTGAPQAYSLIQSGLQQQPQPPAVGNVAFAQRTDGSGLVDVTYDVSDPDSPTVTITLEASLDGGATWNAVVATVSGDVGAGVTPGSGKAIVWDFAADNPGVFSGQAMVRITADDGS